MASISYGSLLVFSTSLFTFLNSLDGGFVFDDHRAILSNADLDVSKTSLWDVFQHDFWGGSMQRAESHKSYRPLTVLSYRYLNHYFRELNPCSYHLVNVLLHGLASVLFLCLCEVVLGKCWWSVLAALLFAVHSVHTEAVASAVGRAEVLSCIFFLLAVLTYLRAISEGRGRTIKSLTRIKIHLVILTIVFSACAMLSKEQGVTAIGVCAGYDCLLNWKVLQSIAKKGAPPIQRGSHPFPLANSVSDKDEGEKIMSKKLTGRSNGSGGKGRSRSSRGTGGHEQEMLHCSVIWRLVMLMVAGGILLMLRLTLNYGSEPIFKPEELRAAFHPNRTVRMLSFSNIYTWNAWLLLAPSDLCCDWSLGSVPLVVSLTDPRNIWSGVLYGALLLLGLHIIRSEKDRVSVGIALTLILAPFLPASGVLFRVGFVIAERVLYLPSLGFCLLISIGARRLASSFHSWLGKRCVWLAMIFLLTIMVLKTRSRNTDWATDLDLFISAVKVNPGNVKMHNNLGMELKAEGRTELAKEEYLRAIEIEPDYAEVYFNYGNLLSDERKYAEAALSFEKAITNPQMYAKTLNNLATTYYRLGRWREAEERFKESLRLTSDVATTYNNLASLYGEMKRYKESEEAFRKALDIHPTYTEAYFNLGTLLFQMGRVDEAEEHLQHALKLNPNHSGAANNLRVVEHHKAKQRLTVT